MDELHHWIKERTKDGDVFFIQIGANDGRSIGGLNGGDDDPDPIYKHVIENGWSGVLVEPVKHIFEELKDNYKGINNLYFENSAINNGSDYRDFYRIKTSNKKLPWFYEKLGTFYLDVLLKERCSIPNIEDHIIKEKVKCIGFNQLLKKYSVEKIDLLVIDTEGHDYEIFKEITFEHIRPRAILMEHKHISENEFVCCKKLLKKYGYQYFCNERDVFACF